MDKGDFGKIRDAVKGLARVKSDEDGNTGSLNKYHKDSFLFFRELREREPHVFSTVIQTLSATKKLRIEIGDKRYELFAKVAEEKEAEYRRANPDLFQSINENPSASEDEKSEAMMKIISKFTDDVRPMIENDPRIREAFKGEEDLFKTFMESQTATTKIFFQGILSQSRFKKELH